MYRILCFLFFLSYSPLFVSLSNSTRLYVSASSSDDCNLASFSKTDTWKEGTNCCSWDGVTCNRVTDLVIGLDLSCSGLYGTIDSNSSLFLLPHLRRLNLAFNDFNKMTHLNLSFSGFSLHCTCSKPNKVAETSSTRFPDDDLQLPNLKVLKLKGNHDLSGNFPKFNESNSMLLLDLSSTNFSGELPSSIGIPNSLESLDLSFTNFSGELPSSIGSLKSLESLDLSSTQFSGSFLFGSLAAISRVPFPRC
ncbi:hypothetical protein AAG906_019027 [Vitis piasezkii]